MNEQNSFERIVADSVASIGQLAPSLGAIERTVARASRTRQRARWLALVAEPPMRRSSRLAVGSPTARVLAIMISTALLALMVAAGIAASRLLADDEMVALDNGPIIVSGTAYDPSTGEMIGPDPCNCTTDAIWSADGQRVAFRRSTRVYVADLAEETERQLADCTGCDESGDHISMAADGASVAFTDDGDVWLVDVDTGARTRVTDLGEGRRARAPTIAPDGDRLAFVIDGEPGIWVVAVRGGDLSLLTTAAGDFFPREPAWSPDGRSIAYLVGASLGLQLWLVDVPTEEQRRVWDWPGCCIMGWGAPAWSPDGRELAVVATDIADARPSSSQHLLWAVAADGSTARKLVGAAPVRPAWRPVQPPEAATPTTDAVAEGSPMHT